MIMIINITFLYLGIGEMNELCARKLKLLFVLLALTVLKLTACSKGDGAATGSEAANVAPANDSTTGKYTS